MAIGFERRKASLIGAGDLPIVRTTVETPDLGGIRRLGGAMMNAGVRKTLEAEAEAKAEARRAETEARAEAMAKQAMQDKLRGLEAGAAAGQQYVGKGSNGYQPFELPDDTPEFQRAYFEGFNQVQDGKFRASLEARYNEIGARITSGELTPDDADVLMKGYLEGAIEKAPAFRRGAWFEIGQSEIAQRSYLIRSQAASRDVELVTQETNALIDRTVSETISKAAAGGDVAGNLAQIDNYYDTLVGLKRMGKAQADQSKLAVREVITANAFVNQLTVALARGQVDPAQIDRFGTAIEVNDSSATVTIRRSIEAGPGSIPVGQDKSFASKDVIAGITDPVIKKQVSLQLRTAAADRLQWENANAEDRAFASELAYLASPEGQFSSLSSGNRDMADKTMDRILAATKPFDNAQDAAGLVADLGRIKYVPKPLVNQLVNRANSGDPEQVKRAIDLYRMLTTHVTPEGNAAGEALRYSFPDDARAFLDGLSNTIASGVSPDMAAANIKKARGNPEYSEGALMAQYNLKVKNDAAGDGFWSDFRARWMSDYEGVPGAEAKNNFLSAYRSNMIVSNDPQASFDNAYKSTAERFRKSPIIMGGVETGPYTLSNPDGYEVKDTGLFGAGRPGSEYEWVNGYVAEELTDLLASGTMILPTTRDNTEMTADQFRSLYVSQKPEASNIGGLWSYLAKPSEAFNSNFLGKTAFLQPVPGGDPDMPRFQIIMRDAQGHALGPVLIERNGAVQPFTINPYLEKQQVQGKLVARNIYGVQQQAAKDQVNALNWRYMSKGNFTRGEVMGYDRKLPFADYLGTVAPELSKQYSIDLQEIQDGLDKAAEDLEKATGDKVPRSKVDQLTMLQPRAAGFDVAAASAAMVDSVLPDGTGGTFLLRIAAQESNFGMAPGTFRLSGDKGMTQINTTSGFVMVADAIRRGKGPVYEGARKLEQAFGIDLQNVTRSDLDKPIVAMAMARLYVEAIGKPVPQDVPGQAAWWKRHYNTHLGAGTIAQFVRSAGKVPDDWRSSFMEG